MEEWKEYRIGDLGRIVTGKTPKTSIKENYGGIIPFLTPSDDLSNKYAPNTNKKITELGLDEVKNCHLPPNSVCVSCIGSDLGKVVMLREHSVTNQQFNSIIPNDEFCPDYIYYLMTIVGKELNFIGKTSTAVPIVNKSSFSNTGVKVPSFPTQQKIANILSSLDDKIEVNRRINEQLEELAGALFKSWFVDFEPFKDGEFVDSELGMIPKGWKVGTLGELIDIKYGKDHKKLSDGNIPVYGSGGIMRYVDKSLYEGESVLIPRKGTLNNVMYVNQDFWTVDTMFFSKMKMSNIAIFVYLFLSKKDLASMNSGSAVPSMTVDILNKISLVIPNEKTFENFNNIVSTLFFQMSNNAKEINHLITLRDTLLPKLMSEGFIF